MNITFFADPIGTPVGDNLDFLTPIFHSLETYLVIGGMIAILFTLIGILCKGLSTSRSLSHYDYSRIKEIESAKETVPVKSIYDRVSDSSPSYYPSRIKEIESAKETVPVKSIYDRVWETMRAITEEEHWLSEYLLKKDEGLEYLVSPRGKANYDLLLIAKESYQVNDISLDDSDELEQRSENELWQFTPLADKYLAALRKIHKNFNNESRNGEFIPF